jgi:hypothetical protein
VRFVAVRFVAVPPAAVRFAAGRAFARFFADALLRAVLAALFFADRFRAVEVVLPARAPARLRPAVLASFRLAITRSFRTPEAAVNLDSSR